MTEIISLSLDDECSVILSKIPSKQRSKFIRNKIKSSVIPNTQLIINSLENKSITEKELFDFIKRMKELLEARTG